MTTMEGFVCWENGSVRRTVYSDIGALASDADAVFLAAHTPMILSHPLGETVLGEGSGERDVLNALRAGMSDAERNTLIAVTGDSGAGKSHVVRWVHAHLDADESRFHVLYVPRAVQTIRELLRRIVDGLPGNGGAELMDRVDAAINNVSAAELQDRLLEEMRLALTWTLDPKPARDGETSDQRDEREDRNNLLGVNDGRGKRRHGLADLLALTPINQKLLRPDGKLDRVVRSIHAEASRRDDQQGGFDRADLPLQQAGVRAALKGNEDLQELWNIILEEPDLALDVLDEALHEAMVKTLGLRSQHGETLDMLFRQARLALRAEGKDLVLLFEDLAQFGLIDGELYDQFATQPGSDMAPLRVVFAVTDGPFDKIVNTVRGRIAHRFVVDNKSLANREEFVARYLNLVRLGRDEVESAWTHAEKTGDSEWVKNACDVASDGEPCQFRTRCHSGFGAIAVPGLGDVGLYPYNAAALNKALNRPPATPKTPRQDLDVCVTEALNEAYVHIPGGTYPHPRTWDRFEHTVHKGKDALLGGESGELAERLYRALVLWGNEDRVAPVISEAFRLPVTTVAPDQRSAGEESVVRKPQNPQPSAPRSTPSPLQTLWQWQNGADLKHGEITEYRKILYSLVSSRLEFDEYLIHTPAGSKSAELLDKYFKRASFEFGEDAYGRKVGAESIRFELGRNSEDVKVLMAARWYIEHFHWDPDSGSWPWPPGFDPTDLALALEQRLQLWVEAVRDGFMSRFKVRHVAPAALGVRAIASMCMGTTAKHMRTVDGALARVSPEDKTPIWTGVHAVAFELLSGTLVTDLIGQFAAVRQGTGAPLLVDAHSMREHLDRSLRSPTAFLQSVVDDLAPTSSDLADIAKRLLASITKAAPAMVREADGAVDSLSSGLAGATPAAAATAATVIKRKSVATGFFRPEDGIAAFEHAAKTLQRVPADIPLQWRQNSDDNQADEAIRMQWWAQKAIDGAQAIHVIRQSIAATLAECLRNTPQSGDMDKLEHQIREKLIEVKRLVRALHRTEAIDA